MILSFKHKLIIPGKLQRQDKQPRGCQKSPNNRPVRGTIVNCQEKTTEIVWPHIKRWRAVCKFSKVPGKTRRDQLKQLGEITPVVGQNLDDQIYWRQAAMNGDNWRMLVDVASGVPTANIGYETVRK